MAAVDAWQPESQVVMLKVRQVVGEENDTDSDGCSWIILVISPAEKYMVSDRLASVHQSLQRRRCDVGCRCASRSSSGQRALATSHGAERVDESHPSAKSAAFATATSSPAATWTRASCS